MRRLILIAALAAALGSCRETEPEPLTLPAPEADDSGDSAITLVPPGYERAAAGLTHLFHVNGEVFATIDPIDGEVLFLDRSGKQLGAARLPDGFDVRDIDLRPSIVLRGDRDAVVIPRSGAIPPELKRVALPPPATTVTRSGRSLELVLGTTKMTVAAQGPGQVLAATALGTDREGWAYAYWEEGEGRRIDAWVGRFGRDGRLIAADRLDFSGLAEVPAVPVAVEPKGTLLMLQPGEEAVELIELTLAQGAIGEAREAVTGRPAVRVLDLGGEKPPPAPPAVARPRGPIPPYDQAFAAAAIKRARAFLDARWTLSPANFVRPGIVHECEPPDGKYWTRPTRFSAAHVGKQVAAVPYKWGGFDSVEQFQRRMSAARPALAGDVCTCREARFDGCLVAAAAGIDCSGFVSRSWDLGEHRGTSQLAGIAADLPDLFHLKPGDILNRPGAHVRLFVGFEPGPEVRLRTLESAVSCGGVCERVFTPAQLAAYRPMRLRRAG